MFDSLEVLKNQLLNSGLTGVWLINTGQLRQIGKTTAILAVANMFLEYNRIGLVESRSIPKANIFIVVSNEFVAKRLRVQTSAAVTTIEKLEFDTAPYQGQLVLLFDEISQSDKQKVLNFVAENSNRICFKAGWQYVI